MMECDPPLSPDEPVVLAHPANTAAAAGATPYRAIFTPLRSAVVTFRCRMLARTGAQWNQGQPGRRRRSRRISTGERIEQPLEQRLEPAGAPRRRLRSRSAATAPGAGRRP